MAKILIVEDEKAINDLVKFNLELVGHECSQVFDGESGLTEALNRNLRGLSADRITLPIIMRIEEGNRLVSIERVDGEESGETPEDTAEEVTQ